MSMYDLIEYCDNYSKTSGRLWLYCKKIPAVNNDGDIVDFDGANATGQTNDDGGIDNVEIMVPLKYLSNFWKTLKMPLINREVELFLTWSANSVIIYTNDNAKLLTQLKSGFKRTISWTKYLQKPELLAQNANLNHLIEPGFQGVNRPFILSFENDAQRTSNKRFRIPNKKIKDYNVMNDGKNFFDQPIKNDKVLYENVKKIATGQGDDYTTGFLLDCIYFKNYYKMIVVDLSKQQALDADPKEIQQINFAGNLDRAERTRFYFIL